MVKVERSFPAPKSLAMEAKKKDGSYSGMDVVERLKEDFNNKCYICELKDLQDPQIEHLLPHKNRKYLERKFDWNNLFWVCGHCNNVKNQAKYDEGILDCCNQDPENAILFDDPNHSQEEERFMMLGLSDHAKMLIVCHCYRGMDDVIRIISARKATKNETTQYYKINERW